MLATDSFFMAMFFFLSGLFVWPGLARKGALDFLRDRLVRLGLPFVIAAFTVIPFAYYAISLRQHPDISFAEFWWNTITVGPWPSGPIWFVWVLLAFDLRRACCIGCHPGCSIRSIDCRCAAIDRPAQFFLFLLAVTAVVYIPGRVYFGAGRWFEFGPFSVQAGRVLLYAAYFFIGAGIGAAEFRSRRC